MRKNLLVVLVLALIAMVSATAFGQACPGSWTFVQNGVTLAWSASQFTASGSATGCYIPTPTIDPTYTSTTTPSLGNGILTNTYTWIYNPITNGLVLKTSGYTTTNPSFGTVGVNGFVSGPPVNGVTVFNGYGIPVNGILQPTYGTGYNGVAVPNLGPLGNGYTTVYVLNGQLVSKGTAGAANVIVATGAVAWSGQAYDSSNGAALDVLGGHGASSGCMNCHTPHNSGRLDATKPAMYNSTLGNVYSVSIVNGVATGTVVGNYFTNAAAGPFSPYAPTNTPAFVWKSSGYGTQLGGSMNPYLWNHALTQVTYNTWDGTATTNTTGGGVSTINATLLISGKEPVVHTLLCLSCHDNSMSSHGMTNPSITKTNGFVTAAGSGQITEPGVVTGTVASAGATVAWGAGSLATSHPVDALYPADGGIAALGGSYYWKVTPNADGTVTYTDTDTNQIGDSGFYGHPGRLYSDGTKAWVECTSCHNPHRQTSPAWVNTTGKYTVGAYGTTTYYIRGPYSTLDGTISAGFCRSCHYDKSPEYIANSGASK
jgi:hypothetical protein